MLRVIMLSVEVPCIYSVDTRHNDTQYNDAQYNDTQHNDTQHNDTHHNNTHHNNTKIIYNFISFMNTFRTIVTLSLIIVRSIVNKLNYKLKKRVRFMTN
jgi:hypothetical protein